MKESFKMTVMLVIAASVIFIAASVAESTTAVVNTPDTTIKKYIDEEANMMCYYTDTWGSCFYVLED